MERCVGCAVVGGLFCFSLMSLEQCFRWAVKSGCSRDETACKSVNKSLQIVLHLCIHDATSQKGWMQSHQGALASDG